MMIFNKSLTVMMIQKFMFLMSYRDDNLQQEFDSDDGSKIHVLDELKR